MLRVYICMWLGIDQFFNLPQGKFGSRWKDIAKSAIGQAVLHLTKTEETARIPQPGLFSQSVSPSLVL